MAKISKVTSDFSVAAALQPEDFAQLASLGFKTVISFLPDQDSRGLSAHASRGLSEKAGLHFVTIPSFSHEVFTDPVVTAAVAALMSARGPVLAYCSSGQRALIIWAAAQARQRSATSILKQLQSAGFDLDFLRDDLEAQADRARWNTDRILPISTADNNVHTAQA